VEGADNHSGCMNTQYPTAITTATPTATTTMNCTYLAERITLSLEVSAPVPKLVTRHNATRCDVM
jgi:hypothetical protein